MSREKEKKEEKKQEKAHDKKGEKHNKSHADELKERDVKLAEMTDKYMRALAELDNTRKRIVKEKEDYIKFAKRDAVEIFLPVLDNLDRAVHATKVTENVESLKKGIEMVIKQFEDIMKEIGAKEINTKGEFDPDFHHVIHKEHRDDRKEGEILEVYQKGYIIDNTVIRPARVKVAVKGKSDSDSGSQIPNPSKESDE